MDGVARYVYTAVYVLIATAAAWSARSLVALPDLVAVYLLVIMLAAVRYGRGPAIAASAVSVIAYDVVFVAPHYRFEVHDQRNLLTFALMFAVGLVISHLTMRIRRQEQEAKAAALRARTEEIRSSLLSAVSHDLRTPLAAITGAGSALRDEGGGLSERERSDLLETICDEADRLERLVANLLDMTRVEAGTLEVKREWVPVDELVGSALARVEPRIEGRRISTRIPPDLPLAAVDPVLVEQALVNLLENALKYTPPGSPIEIGARAVDGAIQLELADRGPGLPAEPEPLFEKFVRQAPSGVGGVGLGLPIARGIARAHGGDVTAANRPDGGARFTLRLPLGANSPEVIAPESEGP